MVEVSDGVTVAEARWENTLMTKDEYRISDKPRYPKGERQTLLAANHSSCVTRHSWLALLAAFCTVACFLTSSPPARAGGGALEIRNGYFWDPIAANYFIPRGLAYQTCNPPAGAHQSFAQVDYDFLEFKKMHATSVRCEIVWGEIEKAEGNYDWSKPDHLIAEAEKLGLKLFILIGYQYPPAWFPKA